MKDDGLRQFARFLLTAAVWGTAGLWLALLFWLEDSDHDARRLP